MKRILAVALWVLLLAGAVQAQVPVNWARPDLWPPGMQANPIQVLVQRSIDSPPYYQSNIGILVSAGSGYTTPILTYGYRSQNSKIGYWPYFYFITPVGNKGEVLVRSYLNGTLVKWIRLGPNGGNSDYMMCDSIRVYSSATCTDTLYYGGEFNR